DSTAISSRLGPRRAEELRQLHFGLLRAAIAASNGAEVKNLGDGLMVVFEAPSAALHCAAAMQRALHTYNQDAPEPLLVRVGVSHGEAQLAEGDSFGPPVVEAARLCSWAQGGQIVTSELVRSMVGAWGGFAFVTQGDVELKGLAQPVAACLVEWMHTSEP